MKTKRQKDVEKASKVLTAWVTAKATVSLTAMEGRFFSLSVQGRLHKHAAGVETFFHFKAGLFSAIIWVERAKLVSIETYEEGSAIRVAGPDDGRITLAVFHTPESQAKWLEFSGGRLI